MAKPPTSPLLAADCVVFDNDKRGVVLIKRKNEPFKGQYALPGGMVEVGETVEAACIREMKEETNLDIKIIKLIGVYSDPGRDPRGHVVSVAFLAEADLSQLKAGSDAAEVELFTGTWGMLDMAFDHKQVLMDADDIFHYEIKGDRVSTSRFNAVLKSARLKKNLEIKDVAKATGVSEHDCFELENVRADYEYTASLEDLIKICSFLELDCRETILGKYVEIYEAKTPGEVKQMIGDYIKSKGITHEDFEMEVGWELPYDFMDISAIRKNYPLWFHKNLASVLENVTWQEIALAYL